MAIVLIGIGILIGVSISAAYALYKYMCYLSGCIEEWSKEE